MRGSELSLVTHSPVMETQSWLLELRKVMAASGGPFSRSLNFWECALARKRKSGPVRLATAMERPTGWGGDVSIVVGFGVGVDGGGGDGTR